MLEVRGLNAFYGESQVLWDVSLDVPAGSVVCLMGRNGVGKTTLLKSIMGLLPVRSGRVTFDGTDLGGRRPEERASCGIGYVPQGREIFPTLTVQENLRMGMLGRGQSGGNGHGDPLEHVFELFPKLKGLLGRKGGVLSGGEQQQLAIARVLLAMNGVQYFDFIDASAPERAMPRKVDLVVSFRSWCFHFEPDSYLDLVQSWCVAGKTRLIVDVRRNKPEWDSMLRLAFRFVDIVYQGAKFTTLLLEAR